MSETRVRQSGIVPLLSVPIATRNCARYLPRAIDSALRAGAALNLPFEIVIADDVPACQVVGRIRGRAHDYDRRAPVVSRCELCGFQYLLPTTCCGRATDAAPLLYYQIVSSQLPPEPSPEFSFLFLTRNQLALTRRAVESVLSRLGDAGVELIFVDGGSTDGTLDAIRAWAEILPVKLVLIPPEERFYYSCSCNRGARAAMGAYLVLSNNDAEFHSEDLVPALRAALSDPRVGIAGASPVRDEVKGLCSASEKIDWRPGILRRSRTEKELVGIASIAGGPGAHAWFETFCLWKR